ncbi:hypothetical protein IAU60_006302 [Kwoniella sp. DSM 27419]
MYTPVLLTLLVALLGQQVQAWVDAFFVVQHAPALLTTRLDPIVNPGGISSHVHSIIGSSSFKPDYTYDNNMHGRCTTANVAVDRSSYWTPQLYRKTDDGKFQMVRMNRANTYYLVRRGSQTEQIHEFPPGFRMIAGNPSRTTYDPNDYSNKAISYVCLGRDGAPETGAFPTQSCPSDLRAQIFFPNCWDGVNNWLEGSKHVAYPTSQGYNSGGPCPATHPKRIMSVFYEFHFSDNFPYKEGARVWATGDDVGYSLHADMTFAWPKGVLSEVVAAGEPCAVDFSIEKCPPIAKYLVNNGSACTLDPGFLTVNEDVGANAPIAKLPGNNPVWGRSGPKKLDPNYKETGSLTTATIPVTSGWTKLGCLHEPQGGRALTAARTTDQTMTPEKCISFCASKGYSLAGVEWSVECYCDNAVTGTSLSNIDKNANCGMPCNGLDYSQGFCGGSSTLTVYQKKAGGAAAVSASKAASSAASKTSFKATSTAKTSTTSSKKATSTSSVKKATTTSSSKKATATSSSKAATKTRRSRQ